MNPYKQVEEIQLFNMGECDLVFFHCQDYVVNVTEEFLEFISEGALAIEVWGHRCTGNGSSAWEVDSLHAKTRTLRDRYK